MSRCTDKYTIVHKAHVSKLLQTFQKQNDNTCQTVFQKVSSTIMPDQSILKVTLNPYLLPLAHIARKEGTAFPNVS